MAQVLDVATGKVVDIPDTEVGAAVAAGRATLPKGEVAAFTPNGDAVYVQAEDAQKALQQGYRLASDAERTELRQQEEFGNSEVRAAAEGLARGATFGLSDVLATSLGASAEGLRERQARNETGALVGEVTGAVGAGLLTGGVGTAGAAAGAGRTASALVMRTMLRGSLEGAVAGVGQVISDDALGKEPLTVQRAMAAAGTGALFGAGIGGVAGAAGVAGSRILGKGAKALEEAVEDIPTTATPAASGPRVRGPDGRFLTKAEAERLGLVPLAEAPSPSPEALRDAVADPAIEALAAAGRKSKGPLVSRLVDSVDWGDVAMGAVLTGNPAGALLGAGTGILRKWGKEAFGTLAAAMLERHSASTALQRTAEALRKVVGKGGASGAAGAMGAAASAAEPFMGVLRSAATLGSGELLATHTALSADPAYRQAMEGAGLRFSDATDEEGRQRAEALARLDSQARRYEARVDAAADAIATGKPASRRSLTRDAALERAKRVLELAQEPDGITSALARQSGRLDAIAPGAADAVRDVGARGLGFLSQKAPKPPESPVGAMAALRQPWAPSEVEVERFRRYADAVEDPIGTVEDMAAGKASAESVEALGAVYPELLGDMRTRVLERLTRVQSPLPYSRRVSLGIMLGVPADETLKPEVLAGLQRIHQQQPEAPQSRPSPRASAKLETQLSPAERIANRGALS